MNDTSENFECQSYCGFVASDTEMQALRRATVAKLTPPNRPLAARGRFRRRSIFLVFLAVSLLAPGGRCASASEPDREARPIVVRAVLDNQAITPVTARYIDRALREAESRHAQCLVLEINTPGGLLDSTRQIVSQIITSRIPVVTYVAPAGARAASAGLFITLAGDIAAMAPGTNIGAAHPVAMGGLPIGPQPSSSPAPTKTSDKGESGEQGSPMEEKIVNDTQAWARSLAQLRGRNSEWAALAVSESRSITASEAVKQHVVDLMADNLDDLLHQIDGRQVALLHGHVRLRTVGADVQTVSMWWGEDVLAILSNPTVAVVLLVLGFFGVLFEFYHPGWGIVGTVGVICFVLGLFGISVLPISYTGLVLILVALGMFGAEVFVHAYGVLTLGGVLCLLLGAAMLVDSPSGFLRVSMGVVAPLAAAIALIVLFLASNVLRAQRSRVQTGGEGLLGRRAILDQAFASVNGHYAGYVRIHGELWRAESDSAVEPGQVEVIARHGLTLIVRQTKK